MKKLWKRILMALTSFVFVLLTVVVGVFPTTVSVIADTTSSVSAYESRNVLDDLKNATIDGETFSLKEYGFNDKKETQVLSFVEYCYSFYSDKQNDYGLYVYVWNPKGLHFDTESNLNQIQFVYGESTNAHYTKYPLRFLNYSTETNYERLFYKFKVVLTNEQRAAILATVKSTERVYRVSGIELLTKGQTNATDYAVATTYKFSGYAAGYGSDGSSRNTLISSSEQNDVLSLAVHATQYRPEGTNGKNEYTQDSLHSVYFAVPNEYIEKYGEMSAVHATWLNAVLKPALVTGNWDAYKAIRAFLGVDSDLINNSITGLKPGDGIGGGGGGARSSGVNVLVGNLDYGYIGAYKKGYDSGVIWHKGDMVYLPYGFSMPDIEQYERELSALYMLFYSGSGEDSADNYTVRSEVLYEELKASAATYGGTLVNNKYAECMFESVDSEFTDLNIHRSETYSLTSETITQNWWQKLWGTSTTVSNKFDGINAIYPVKASDVSGINKEIAERLYISESDCDEFKNFYNANKSLCKKTKNV